MFQQGGIYQYSYLWAREHDGGEESGRKVRPVCLIFRSEGGRLFVLPITTRRPDAAEIARAIPPRERRLGGLSQPSSLVLSEFNSSFERQSYDFATIKPQGRFSDGYVDTVLAELLKQPQEHVSVLP